jgi:hypothetical protein
MTFNSNTTTLFALAVSCAIMLPSAHADNLLGGVTGTVGNLTGGVTNTVGAVTGGAVTSTTGAVTGPVGTSPANVASINANIQLLNSGSVSNRELLKVKAVVLGSAVLKAELLGGRPRSPAAKANVIVSDMNRKQLISVCLAVGETGCSGMKNPLLKAVALNAVTAAISTGILPANVTGIIPKVNVSVPNVADICINNCGTNGGTTTPTKPRVYVATSTTINSDNSRYDAFANRCVKFIDGIKYIRAKCRILK